MKAKRINFRFGLGFEIINRVKKSSSLVLKSYHIEALKSFVKNTDVGKTYSNQNPETIVLEFDDFGLTESMIVMELEPIFPQWSFTVSALGSSYIPTRLRIR